MPLSLALRMLEEIITQTNLATLFAKTNIYSVSRKSCFQATDNKIRRHFQTYVHTAIFFFTKVT